MKIALLGAAGFLGSVAARELSRRTDVEELILVDYVIRDAKRLAKALSPKCRWAMADVGKPLELSRLLEGIDVVASAVGPCHAYEKTILLACAGMGVAAASAGERTVPEADRREIDVAFRAAGVPAVSGCGMMPGWTGLLSAHFLSGGGEPVRHIFFSPDRFGGYAFLRWLAKEIASPSPGPPGPSGGFWFSLTDGSLVGVPDGKAADRFRWITGSVGRLGPVGRELSAALLLWLRGSMAGGPAAPAVAAGVSSGDRYARVEDPAGRLAALTLVETAALVGCRHPKRTGLLQLHELIGREEAERLAAAAGARITTG